MKKIISLPVSQTTTSAVISLRTILQSELQSDILKNARQSMEIHNLKILFYQRKIGEGKNKQAFEQLLAQETGMKKANEEWLQFLEEKIKP